MAEKVLKDVQKPKTKSSFYRLKTWKSPQGREFIDVREHYTKADGSVQHTTKGISIPVEMFTDMMVAFRDVDEHMRYGTPIPEDQ